MTILIIGGAALGVQAVLLAKAAEFHVVLADKNPACPAKALADEFVNIDVTKAPLPEADLILPATESEAVLNILPGEKALFDLNAWNRTASRLEADEFLRSMGVPIPEYFPRGSEPYLVKPDRGSFGAGIWVTEDFCEVGGAVNAGFVTQEELNGPVWSQVIVGKPGNYTAYAPAKLSFDDRCRTGAACLPASEPEALAETAVKIAEAIGLSGILEVEAIFHRGLWKVIDLNARLPMYTGEALLETGINLLGELSSLL